MPKCDFISYIIEITLLHGCSPVNLLNIFRTPFSKSNYGELLLNIIVDTTLNFNLNAVFFRF